MTRFYTLNEIGTHTYTAAELSSMSDAELIDEINRLDEWDADLLADLIWRAYPDYDEPWEAGDAICYNAAEELGYEI